MPKKYLDSIQDKRITAVEDRMVQITDYYNHQITAIRSEISECNIKLASIEANQKILLAFMGAIGAALIALFFK